jgi:pilus assembly protein FimV
LNIKSQRWPLSSLALAMLMGLNAGTAHALSLGRLHVLSALGEPLRAEIDILDINAAEASTLRTSIAAPEAFKVAGLDYNPALSSVQLQFTRRSDGRAYLQLNGRNPINEPFMDLILEARWSSGRIVRDYTLLLDPPTRRNQLVQVTPLAPPTARPAVAPVSQSSREPAQTSVQTPANRSSKANDSRQAASTNPSTASAPTPASAPVRVQRGETAGKLALRHKAASVSLEQMLLALLRANPDAFIHGNVNLIKAGALVKLPSQAEAQQVSTAEARRLIRAQSKDFNQFRQNLASQAPASNLQTSQRQSQGTVQTQVEESKATATPDKLTLTQATVQGKTTEEHIAQANNQRETSQTFQALSQQVQELDKLAQASQASTPTPAPAATVAPSATPKPAAPAVKPAIQAAVPSTQTSLLDELMANPMVPAGAGALLALLLGWGLYRSRQRKTVEPIDSVLHESRLDEDSFFGNAGGKQIDTRDNPPTGSSMFYTGSQMDAPEEGDAASEANVYLAYGREQQAEEILLEALHDNPQRLSIHRKLLDIYAQRQDVSAFERMAIKARALTQDSGSDWQAICAQGRSIDPDNGLYRGEVGRVDPTGSNLAKQPAEPAPPPSPSSAVTDLDFDLGEPAPQSPSARTTADPVSVPDLPDLPDPEGQWAQQATQPMLGDLAEQPGAESHSPDQDIDLDLDLPTPAESASSAPATEATEPVKQPDHNLMEFDLGDLSLDLDAGSPADQDQAALEAKLAQAEALEAQGDHEGARALIQEVIAHATDEVKAKASDTLNKL